MIMPRYGQINVNQSRDMDDNHFFVSNQGIYLNHDIHIFIDVGNNPKPSDMDNSSLVCSQFL